MMFKILVLQALYGLSDEQAEFQIMDRRTFGRFLGLRMPATGSTRVAGEHQHRLRSVGRHGVSVE